MARRHRSPRTWFLATAISFFACTGGCNVPDNGPGVVTVDGQPAEATAEPWPSKRELPLGPGNVIRGVKYSVEFELEPMDGQLPSADDLRAISDEVAAANPGYERYFIGFYLPGMERDAGYWATAHRTPDVNVSYTGVPVPEPYREMAQRASE